jgi:hypothetical protein
MNNALDAQAAPIDFLEIRRDPKRSEETPAASHPTIVGDDEFRGRMMFAPSSSAS